jgi:uncharacterized damage-inducible protein DinB
MFMSGFLHILIRYQAWANAAFFDKLETMDSEQHGAVFHDALRLMTHCYVVADIFAAHLKGETHGYESDNIVDTPVLADLRTQVQKIDHWYLNYISNITMTARAEKIAFTFTDGDNGYMSREEMITHVVLHGGYHRGEIGQFLKQASVTPPWDTFAVFAHHDQPLRRHQGKL